MKISCRGYGVIVLWACVCRSAGALRVLGAIKAAGDDCASGVNPTSVRVAKITRLARPQVQIILSAHKSAALHSRQPLSAASPFLLYNRVGLLPTIWYFFNKFPEWPGRCVPGCRPCPAHKHKYVSANKCDFECCNISLWVCRKMLSLFLGPKQGFRRRVCADSLGMAARFFVCAKSCAGMDAIGNSISLL